MTLAAPMTATACHLPRPHALSLSQVSFGYSGAAQILESVSSTIYSGERVGLIGPNGAGKTTLFLLICGVLKATAGEMSLFNQPIVPQAFRPKLGFVFQNAADQLFSLSVREDVAFGPSNMGLSEVEIEERVDAALMLTGTKHLADRASHHLSGGEKRMVAIATILAMQPEFIIYDEPSANLDLRARRRLIQFLESCPQTMMVSSHDLELVLEVCDRVLLLDEGQILADGHPAEIMRDQALMEAHGLEVPSALKCCH